MWIGRRRSLVAAREERRHVYCGGRCWPSVPDIPPEHPQQQYARRPQRDPQRSGQARSQRNGGRRWRGGLQQVQKVQLVRGQGRSRPIPSLEALARPRLMHGEQRGDRRRQEPRAIRFEASEQGRQDRGFAIARIAPASNRIDDDRLRGGGCGKAGNCDTRQGDLLSKMPLFFIARQSLRVRALHRRDNSAWQPDRCLRHPFHGVSDV